MKWHVQHQNEAHMKMTYASFVHAARNAAVRLLLGSSLALTMQPALAGFDEAAAAFAAGAAAAFALRAGAATGAPIGVPAARTASTCAGVGSAASLASVPCGWGAGSGGRAWP